MAASALKEGNPVVLGPDHKPIARICYMALISSRPTAGKAMHIMPAFEDLNRFRRVLQHEIDELTEFLKIPVATLRLLLQITRKGRGEIGGESPHYAIAAAIRSAPFE